MPRSNASRRFHAHKLPPPAPRTPMTLLVAAALAVSGGWLFALSPVEAAPADDSVLILGTTVGYGTASTEATYAASLGFTVDIVDADTWAGMSAEDFGRYRAIILGDYPCGYPGDGYITPAELNAGTWGPEVDGNILIAGTDPEVHGRPLLTQNAIDFAVAEPGKTGAYISLSCYYHFASPGTEAPALSGLSTFGDFTVTGMGDCFDSVHVVADHPALAGTDDAYLSNWGCSIHEGLDSWPSDFVVLALGTTGGAYTATDGTVGTPYILVRGESIEVVSDITLDGPATATVGASINYVATAETGATPVEGATVTFTALPGSVHEGSLGTAVTDAAGVATLAFVGSVAGTDLVTASFETNEGTQTSGPLSVTWSVAESAPPSVAPATVAPTTAPATNGPTVAPATSGPTGAPTTPPAATTAPTALVGGAGVSITPPPTDSDIQSVTSTNPTGLMGLVMLLIAGALALSDVLARWRERGAALPTERV
jgi:hypothetical protein